LELSQNENFVKFLWKFCEDFMEVCGKFLFGGSFVKVIIGSSYCNSTALYLVRMMFLLLLLLVLS
jgi:hypothetical protein